MVESKAHFYLHVMHPWGGGGVCDKEIKNVKVWWGFIHLCVQRVKRRKGLFSAQQGF